MNMLEIKKKKSKSFYHDFCGKMEIDFFFQIQTCYMRNKNTPVNAILWFNLLI